MGKLMLNDINYSGRNGDIIQYSTMPTASIDNLNKIIQYIGTTTVSYTNGYFYKCIFDDPNYVWDSIQVSEGGDVSGKADKVSGATSGNFASLDSNGNIIDSGKKASDFSTIKESESATDEGTTLSLVTTGEKYIWNDKVSKSPTAGLIKNDGTIDTNSYATSTTAYLTDDTAETDLDDADYVPFYDSSATAKRKTLWSNIKSKLKAYFDLIYNNYLETDVYTSPDSNTRRFTFTSNFITNNKEYDFSTDVLGAYPKSTNISGTTMTVDFNANLSTTKCRLYIKE